jgi:hypothetical protein
VGVQAHFRRGHPCRFPDTLARVLGSSSFSVALVVIVSSSSGAAATRFAYTSNTSRDIVSVFVTASDTLIDTTPILALSAAPFQPAGQSSIS